MKPFRLLCVCLCAVAISAPVFAQDRVDPMQDPTYDPLSDPNLDPSFDPAIADQDPDAFEIPNPFAFTEDGERALQEEFRNPARMPGVMGASRLGQVTGFDSTFNPAIGVVLDAVAEFANVPLTGAERYNQFRVRAAELNAASRVDPLGWAYVNAVFVDSGAETDVELEEAMLWLDQLPDTFSLRGGKYLADFGRWNPFHTHDKPYVNEDIVRGEFFGGPLINTGVELHHWFGLGDVPVRWSIGVASEAEGDDHDMHHEHGDIEPFGRRGIDNMAATARITAQVDTSENGYLQIGTSGFYAPGMLDYAEVPAGSGFIAKREVRNAVGALDVTWRNVNAASLTADTASFEVWYQNGQVFDDATALIMSDSNMGLWGFYEHAFSPFWSAGAVAGWVEARDSFNGTNFLSGGMSRATRGAFVTWNLSEFNRLRVQVLHTNPGLGIDKFWTVAVQWNMILGSHAHPIEW